MRCLGCRPGNPKLAAVATSLGIAFDSTFIGGVWIHGDSAIAGPEAWYQAVTGVSMFITAPAYDRMLTAWHELEHWMTSMICLRDKVDMHWLPELIAEGIAAYTEAFLVGLSGRKQHAAAWTTENALSVELDEFDTYPIGASVVECLVQRDGIAGLLGACLCGQQIRKGSLLCWSQAGASGWTQSDASVRAHLRMLDHTPWSP